MNTRLASRSLAVVISVFSTGAAQAANFTFFTDPSFDGLVTIDPYLGNADDLVIPGINTIGAASQFRASNGVYGFFGGTMTTQGITAFGPQPQQIFGLNEHVSNDNFGEWNFDPTSLFNQPFTQSLDTGSPTMININPDQTYTTSFVLNDTVSGGRLQINGTGQYLLEWQTPSDFYSGDVLTHFETVIPALPPFWTVVAQESQTWTVLDGPSAGGTGFTTSTFFADDFAAIPRDPPTPLGAPWVTTGFAAIQPESDVPGNIIFVGGQIHDGPPGGPGTAALSGGNVATASVLDVGSGFSGEVTLSGEDTVLNLESPSSLVSNNGVIRVNDGARLNVGGSSAGISTWLIGFAESLLEVDGVGSLVEVSGGTGQFSAFLVEGSSFDNKISIIHGGDLVVKNGGKVIADGPPLTFPGVGEIGETSGIEIGSAGRGIPGIEVSTVLVEGTGSTLDGGAVIVLGTHPGLFSEGAGGELIVRDNGLAKADTIYIGTDGIVKGDGGTLEGVVKNHGTLMPGESPGILNIVGDYIQGAEGMLVIEIGGTDPGMFDVLNVSGTATLGGTLVLELIDGFTPGPTDTFSFLTASVFDGNFADFILPTFGSGQTLAVSLGPGGFSAAVVPIPSAVWLLGSGLGMFGWMRRKAA